MPTSQDADRRQAQDLSGHRGFEMVWRSGLLSRSPEGLRVLEPELAADVVHLARGHGSWRTRSMARAWRMAWSLSMPSFSPNLWQDSASAKPFRRLLPATGRRGCPARCPQASPRWSQGRVYGARGAALWDRYLLRLPLPTVNVPRPPGRSLPTPRAPCARPPCSEPTFSSDSPPIRANPPDCASDRARVQDLR